MPINQWIVISKVDVEKCKLAHLNPEAPSLGVWGAKPVPHKIRLTLMRDAVRTLYMLQLALDAWGNMLLSHPYLKKTSMHHPQCDTRLPLPYTFIHLFSSNLLIQINTFKVKPLLILVWFISHLWARLGSFLWQDQFWILQTHWLLRILTMRSIEWWIP